MAPLGMEPKQCEPCSFFFRSFLLLSLFTATPLSSHFTHKKPPPSSHMFTGPKPSSTWALLRMSFSKPRWLSSHCSWPLKTQLRLSGCTKYQEPLKCPSGGTNRTTCDIHKALPQCFVWRQGFALKSSLALSFQSSCLRLRVPESGLSECFLFSVAIKTNKQKCTVVASYVKIGTLRFTVKWKGKSVQQRDRHPATRVYMLLSAHTYINHL